jgi:dTMP kinase
LRQLKENAGENENKGIFITLEGVEGSGKSTQIKLLENDLKRRGHEVLVIREPGGTPIGDCIREILLNPDFSGMDSNTELLLYMASRAQLVAQVIKPALRAGKTIICDRFTDSCVAYQGFGRGLSLDMIKMLNDWVTQGVLPDLTVVLSLPIEEGLYRATKGTADRIEREDLDFHLRVENGYKILAGESPDRIRLVDAEASPERIHESLAGLVTELLKKKGKEQCGI